uniref:RHS repeat-associated core domain-containing protein n=3 Tax=Lysinibacillus TaxID=400634 RepID=UPI000A72CA2C
FRYYDPEQGNYTQVDPIGLAGGNPTLYGYVGDTNVIIDPLGLKPKPKFNFTELSGDKPLSLNPNEIYFMQSNIKNSTGPFTVLENAASLKNGLLKVSDLPTVNVWKDVDGKIWTLDHRRLAAFRLANIDEIPVNWASRRQVKDQWRKMSTKNGGTSIVLKMEDGTRQVICKKK